jgi:hypothetical protein
MKTILVITTALFVSITIASGLRADMVFNNFGTGNSYDTGAGQSIGTASFQEQGGMFQVSGGSFMLDSVDTAISFSSGTNKATLSLYSTSGGSPTTMLESVTVTPFAKFGTPFKPPAFTFSGTTLLQDGESYALVASAGNSNSSMMWNFNNMGDKGSVSKIAGGVWSSSIGTAPAFRVNATSVPEPTTFMMFGAAWMALAARRRRIA